MNTFDQPSPRKVTGYRNAEHNGVWLKNTDGGYTHINDDGRINPFAFVLNEVVERNPPVYEGELTIKL